MGIVKPLLAAAGMLFATAAIATGAPAAKPVKTTQLKIPSLGKITITGSQLHTLWNIKRGLSRIHSFHDPDALVCRVRGVADSRLKKILFCESNQRWWERTDHVGWISGDALHEAFAASVDYALFLKVMRNLPPESGAQNHPAGRNL